MPFLQVVPQSQWFTLGSKGMAMQKQITGWCQNPWSIQTLRIQKKFFIISFGLWSNFLRSNQNMGPPLYICAKNHLVV